MSRRRRHLIPPWAHLDTTATRRGSAKRNAAFTLQHGAMLTTRQREGCVPVVVSGCALPPSRPAAAAGIFSELLKYGWLVILNWALFCPKLSGELGSARGRI